MQKIKSFSTRSGINLRKPLNIVSREQECYGLQVQLSTQILKHKETTNLGRFDLHFFRNYGQNTLIAAKRKIIFLIARIERAM